MKQVIAAFCAVFLSVAMVAQAFEKTPPEPEGMISLFNGKDLTGWDGDPRFWSVKDGVIHGETTPKKRAYRNTFLIYQAREAGDFELRVSFRLNKNNSGIQYRSSRVSPDPKNPNDPNKWRLRGYQCEIRNQLIPPSVAGFLFDEWGKYNRGRIMLVGEQGTWNNATNKKKVEKRFMTPNEYKELFKKDQWNEMVIIAKGRHLKHYLNGRLVMDFVDVEDKALLKGKIGFQLHAGPAMWAEYKDVRIKYYD